MMKAIIKIFLSLGLIIFSLNVNAQYFSERKVTGEIRGGINFAELDVQNGNIYKTPRLGANLSMLINYRFAGNMRLQTGLCISKKGSRKHEERTYSDALNQSVTIDRTDIIDANYFLTPLLLGYEKYITKEYAFNINAGGYLAYGFKGYTSSEGFQSITVGNNETVTNIKTSGHTFENGPLKRLDYGLAGNIGFVYDVYSFAFGYEYGLCNISAKPNVKITNRNYYLTVGFRF